MMVFVMLFTFAIPASAIDTTETTSYEFDHDGIHYKVELSYDDEGNRIATVTDDYSISTAIKRGDEIIVTVDDGVSVQTYSSFEIIIYGAFDRRRITRYFIHLIHIAQKT